MKKVISSPFIGKSRTGELSIKEHLKILSDFARLDPAIPTFNELLSDGTMAVVQNGFGKPADKPLYTICQPTPQVLQVATIKNIVSYNLFNLLGKFHILVPKKTDNYFGTIGTINIPNGTGGFYDWKLSIQSYQSCIRLIKWVVDSKINIEDEYWDYLGSIKEQKMKKIYEKLIKDLETLEAAKVIFVLDWTV